MPKKLKMYNGVYFVYNLPEEHRASNGNTQKTIYAACHSWKEFATLIGVKPTEARKYGSQCAGEKATKICITNPQKAFYNIESTKNGYFDEIVPLPELPEWKKNNEK